MARVWICGGLTNEQPGCKPQEPPGVVIADGSDGQRASLPTNVIVMKDIEGPMAAV